MDTVCVSKGTFVKCSSRVSGETFDYHNEYFFTKRVLSLYSVVTLWLTDGQKEGREVERMDRQTDGLTDCLTD